MQVLLTHPVYSVYKERNGESKAAWGKLFKPLAPNPLCAGHQGTRFNQNDEYQLEKNSTLVKKKRCSREAGTLFFRFRHCVTRIILFCFQSTECQKSLVQFFIVYSINKNGQNLMDIL